MVTSDVEDKKGSCHWQFTFVMFKGSGESHSAGGEQGCGGGIQARRKGTLGCNSYIFMIIMMIIKLNIVMMIMMLVV